MYHLSLVGDWQVFWNLLQRSMILLLTVNTTAFFCLLHFHIFSIDSTSAVFGIFKFLNTLSILLNCPYFAMHRILPFVSFAKIAMHCQIYPKELPLARIQLEFSLFRGLIIFELVLNFQALGDPQLPWACLKSLHCRVQKAAEFCDKYFYFHSLLPIDLYDHKDLLVNAVDFCIGEIVFISWNLSCSSLLHPYGQPQHALLQG